MFGSKLLADFLVPHGICNATPIVKSHLFTRHAKIRLQQRGIPHEP